MNIAFFSAVRYDSVIGGRTRRLCDALSRRHSVHFIEMPSLRHPCLCREKKISDSVRCCQLMPVPGLWRHFDSLRGQWWVGRTAAFLNRHLPADTQAVASTPFWVPVLKKLRIRSVTYDCLDHLSVQAPGALDPAARLEKELLAMADRTVCVSSTLANELKNRTSKPVYTISNGFPAEYLQERAVFPKSPAAGFCGAMYEWFDFNLVREAAEALPDVHFILTGPVRNPRDLAPLHHIANVELRPAIPFAGVKAEIMRYSAGMIPFKRNAAAFFSNPLKLYEYAALGKPVISTVKGTPDLPVAFAGNSREFVDELNRLVHAPQTNPIDRTVLKKYTWDSIAGNFERILE